MSRLIRGVLVGTLLAFVAFRFAEPISDGDLFWHMAYGRQIWSQICLVPNANAYSWTPVDESTVYCAWVPELIYLGIYDLAGYTGLFVFRYLCLALVVWLLFRYSQQFGFQWAPGTFLLACISILASYVGSILKPELFSLVYFNGLAFAYFSFKSKPESMRRWCWVFPVLMLLWVNSHGVFVFGLMALLILCLGEWLNYLVSSELGLPLQALIPFTVAAGLSVLVVLLNPYGASYPIQLFREFLAMARGQQSSGAAAAYANLAAHQRPWEATDFHFVPLALAMGVTLAFLLFGLSILGRRRSRIDVAVTSVNLLMGVTFFWYVRTTYYWPSFFAYSALYLAGQLSRSWNPGVALRRGFAAGAMGCFLALSIVSSYQAAYYPYALSWCGFGVSYYNPVDEADWVREFVPTDRVMNDYDGGGYLLWKLSPETKVMIDSRSFPYRSWLANYILWENGEHFEDFLLSMGDADVAIISVRHKSLWQAFVRSHLYKVGWIGKSSIVFVANRVKVPPISLKFREDRFRSLKNLVQGSDIYEACLSVGFYDEAWSCLRAMQANFYTTPENRKVIDAFQLYKDAIVADFEVEPKLDRMLELHEKCWKAGVFFRPSRLLELYHSKLDSLGEVPNSAETRKEALDLTVKIQRLEQGLPYAEP